MQNIWRKQKKMHLILMLHLLMMNLVEDYLSM